MKIRLIFILCSVLLMSEKVSAEGENDIKIGLYPYMAFIYYPDQTVVEGTGARFLRGAVLVTPSWLVTSSVGAAMTSDLTNGFPRKTLLARVGALRIDSNFTLNEDEYEQEREIVQIVRPQNHSTTQWWRTDVALLGTLLPFNVTSAVNTASLRAKSDYVDSQNCFILVYAKRYGNFSEDKVLTQINVELQSGLTANCGNHYSQETMLCALDDADKNKSIYDPDFCQGNSGGPLICENEVAGLQTYIENNCKQPHVYQLLSVWDNLISCAVENKCMQDHCATLCKVLNKDNSVKDSTTLILSSSSESTGIEATEEVNMTVVVDKTTLLTTAKVKALQKHFTQKDLPKPSLTTRTSSATNTTTTETTTRLTIISSSPPTEYIEQVWPKEKLTDHTPEDEEKVIRKSNVDARRSKVKGKNSAVKNNCYFQSLFSLFLFICIV